MKAPDGAEILLGDDASFTIVVSNAGPGVAYGVTLSDALEGDGWSEDPDVVECTISEENALGCDLGDMAPGGTFSVTVTKATDFDDCGGLYNVATVGASNEPGGATGNNSDEGSILVECPACSGLTPGYWKNWDNHYEPAEFELLLQGTIAGSTAEADAIFAHWDAEPDDEITILKAMTLAN